MNITVDKPKNSEQKLIIELNELEMEKYLNKAMERLSSQLNIKGFRPGKAPKEMIQQHVTQEYINATAIDLALPVTYSEAIQKEKLEPISRPHINIVQQLPLKYEAVFAVYPDVKVDNQNKISVQKKSVEVSEEEITQDIKRMGKYHAQISDVTRPAQEGDKVEIDFKGFDKDGVQLEGTDSKNHPLVIGEKTLIPGFEEQLIGMNLNEEKTIEVTFPEDYFHKPFQKKLVKFTVKMNKIQEMKLPELNDLILKLYGADKTEADFKESIKKSLLQEKQMQEQDKTENELLDQILKNTKVTLPHALIDEEIAFMVEQEKKQIESRGVSWADYLESRKMKEEDFHDLYHQEAEKRLTLRFGIQQLYKEHNIDITPEELDLAFENELKILSSLNYTPGQFDLENIRTRLKNKLKLEKLINKFTK